MPMNPRAKSLRSGTPRLRPDGAMTLVSCEGTASECGEQLGCAWREVLTFEAEHTSSDKAWWKDRRYQKLVSKYVPHLPDLYRGMASGAALKEDMVAPRAPNEHDGCTSFALAPSATLDRVPISGQNKDGPRKRMAQLLVLRMKIAEGPSCLTLTYPGWLFGHGFVRGGTAIFRNSLYVARPHTGLPFDVWGILALHCPNVEEVMKLTRDYGFDSPGHLTVADERGGIIGIENGAGGPVFPRPKKGVYAHANGVISNPRLLAQERRNNADSYRVDSRHRTERLYAQFEPERGRLTAQLAYRALCDHDGLPRSLCRHEGEEAITGSAVIVEPTRGLLHCTRTSPCQSWPQTYSL